MIKLGICICVHGMYYMLQSTAGRAVCNDNHAEEYPCHDASA